MAKGGGAAAKAYVNIVPKMDGVDKEIESTLGAIADKAGDKAGRQLGKSMAKGASKSLKDSGSLMGEGVQSGFARIFDKQATKIQQRLTEPFKNFGGQVKSSFGEVGSAFGQMASNIAGPKLTGMFSGIVNGAKGAVAKIGGTFAGVGQAIGPALSAAGSVAGTALGKVASVAGPALSKVGDMAKGAFSKVGEAAKGALSGLGDIVKSAFDKVATAAKVGAAGAIAAMATIGKGALSAFGDFEQLQGGVKLALGDDVWATVEERSKSAFSNMQISQNDYLEKVNSMATGLREALGGKGHEQEAADLANRVIQAQADIVSAMGITQEAADNAFSGIMKGNFTMLDNLNLGIKPTKEGMQEVIDKMNEWNATAEDRTATDYTIDNLADCQSALADYVEYMNISGYATAEGADTIQGSVSKMKAAWTDWMGELGKEDGDMSRVSENLSESLQDVARNVLPVVQNAMSNALLQLPNLVTTVGPELTEAFSGIAKSLGTALVGVVDNATGGMASKALKFVEPIRAAWQTAFGSLVTQLQPLGDAMGGLATAYLPIMRDGMVGLAGVFSDVAGVVIPALTGSLNYLSGWITANQPLISSLGAQFGAVAVQIGAALGGAIQTVLPVLLQLGAQVIPVVLSVVSALVPVFSGIVSAVAGFASELMGHLQPAIDTLLPVFQGLASFMATNVMPVVATLAQIFGAVLGDAISWVAQKFADLLNFLAPVGEFVGGVVGGLGDALSGLASKVGISFGETESAVATSTAKVADTASAEVAKIPEAFGESFAGIPDDVAAQMEQASAAVASGASGMDDKMAEAAQAVGESASKGVDVTAMESQAKAMVEAAVAAAKAVDASGVGAAFSKSAASGIDVGAMASQAQQMASATSALTQQATVSVKADTSGISAIKSGAASVQASMRSMQASATASMAAVSKAASSAAPAYQKLASTISSSMQSAARSTQSAAASMNRALSGVRGTTVRINVAAGSVKLPHFYMRGDFNPKTKAVPTVGVNWYAKGGIFPAMRPTVIGVGDARVPEVVTPIDRLADMLRDEDVINRRGASERPINTYIYGVSGPDETADAVTRRIRLLQMAEGR